jgi:signal transduction histidine kinase
LARGLHPILLTESGLGAAVHGLANRSPIFTSVLVGNDRWFPEAVEVTAYYVVAEALANAAKHSHASEVGWSPNRGQERPHHESSRPDHDRQPALQRQRTR